MMQKTSFPFEVLIHDDASTDHTADIIREYEAKYPDIIKPVYQKENQYSKKVRINSKYNFSRAQGKYIALCEGDDYWIDPLKLQTQFDFMESHPDCSMCFHNVEEKQEVKNNTIHVRFTPGYKSGESILSNWSIPTCSTLFRKEVIEIDDRIRERDNRFMYSDIVLFLSAASIGKVYGIDKKMAVYRRHAQGATFRRPDNYFVRTYNHYLALSDAFPDLKYVTEKCICKCMYHALVFRIIKLDIGESKRIFHILKSIRSLKAHVYGLLAAFCEITGI